MSTRIQFLIGLLFIFVIGLLSNFLSLHIPIGSVLLALIIGALINPLYLRNIDHLKPAVVFTKAKILKLAIVILGSTINIAILSAIFMDSLFLIPIIAFVMFATFTFGSYLKVPPEESILHAIGNCVCGSAAIAAAAPIVKSTDEAVGRSLASINLLGVLLLFFFPLFFQLPFINISNPSFIIGGTLQSVGHVGAVSDLFSDEITQQSFGIKMFRVALLSPICLLLSFKFTPSSAGQNSTKMPIPWFLLSFLLAILIGSYVFSHLSPVWLTRFKSVSKFLLAMAMAAIGVQINLKEIFKGATRSLAVGVFACLLMLSLNITLSLLVL